MNAFIPWILGAFELTFQFFLWFFKPILGITALYLKYNDLDFYYIEHTPYVVIILEIISFFIFIRFFFLGKVKVLKEKTNYYIYLKDKKDRHGLSTIILIIALCYLLGYILGDNLPLWTILLLPVGYTIWKTIILKEYFVNN